MFEPGELLDLLRTNHLTLPGDDRQVVRMRASGMRAAEIGRRLFKSERAVQHHLERVQDLLCVPLGLQRHDPVVLGMWISLHLDCERRCLVEAH